MKSRKKKKIVDTTLLSSKKTRSRKINRLQGKIDQKWPPTVEEKFERAYELTKTYAGSANAQASAIPVLFEKLFELFATGYSR